MKFRETAIPGVVVVAPERHEDERGSFARSWCAEEFAAHGLAAALAQCSISHNRRRGTLRGLHYQAEPHGEDKLVRCTRGAAFDVAVDLRPGSPTRYRWTAVEITPGNGLALYLPRGVAHGFQTLADDTDILYQMAQPYRPEAARGLRWDDPTLAIAWPLPDPILSARDAALPTLEAVPA